MVSLPIVIDALCIVKVSMREPSMLDIMRRAALEYIKKPRPNPRRLSQKMSGALK